VKGARLHRKNPIRRGLAEAKIGVHLKQGESEMPAREKRTLLLFVEHF